MCAHLVAAKDTYGSNIMPSTDARPSPRQRSDLERAYRQRAKKPRNTNKGRHIRKANICRLAVIHKNMLLREPGWYSLRQIMRQINQTGPGMRQLHRYRTGDVWNHFGCFTRAFEPYDICTQEELRVREHNYKMHVAAIDAHKVPNGPPSGSCGPPGHEMPN